MVLSRALELSNVLFRQQVSTRFINKGFWAIPVLLNR
jgi:hypothetical protein